MKNERLLSIILSVIGLLIAAFALGRMLRQTKPARRRTYRRVSATCREGR